MNIFESKQNRNWKNMLIQKGTTFCQKGATFCQNVVLFWQNVATFCVTKFASKKTKSEIVLTILLCADHIWFYFSHIWFQNCLVWCLLFFFVQIKFFLFWFFGSWTFLNSVEDLFVHLFFFLSCVCFHVMILLICGHASWECYSIHVLVASLGTKQEQAIQVSNSSSLAKLACGIPFILEQFLARFHIYCVFSTYLFGVPQVKLILANLDAAQTFPNGAKRALHHTYCWPILWWRHHQLYPSHHLHFVILSSGNSWLFCANNAFVENIFHHRTPHVANLVGKESFPKLFKDPNLAHMLLTKCGWETPSQMNIATK